MADEESTTPADLVERLERASQAFNAPAFDFLMRFCAQVVGRRRGSGVPVDAPLGFIEDFRDGKLWRVQGYLDQGEALRAAGLSE